MEWIGGAILVYLAVWGLIRLAKFTGGCVWALIKLGLFLLFVGLLLLAAAQKH